MTPYDNICYKIAYELLDGHQNTNKSFFTPNITLYVDDVDSLLKYCEHEYVTTNIGNEESAPMVWIGIYIAIASLVCTLAMAADLLHGLRNKKILVSL